MEEDASRVASQSNLFVGSEAAHVRIEPTAEPVVEQLFGRGGFGAAADGQLVDVSGLRMSPADVGVKVAEDRFAAEDVDGAAVRLESGESVLDLVGGRSDIRVAVVSGFVADHNQHHLAASSHLAVLLHRGLDGQAHVLLAGAVDRDAIDRLHDLARVGGWLGCVDVETGTEAGDGRQQDVIVGGSGGVLPVQLCGVRLDQLQLFVNPMQSPLQLFLIVLHALGFVEHPDGQDFFGPHQSEQFLSQPVQGCSVTFDQRSNFTGDFGFAEVLTQAIQPGQCGVDQFDLDVGFPDDLFEFDLGLLSERCVRASDDRRLDAAGGDVHRLGDGLGIVEFLLEFLAITLFGLHDRFENGLGFSENQWPGQHGQTEHDGDVDSDRKHERRRSSALECHLLAPQIRRARMARHSARITVPTMTQKTQSCNLILVGKAVGEGQRPEAGRFACGSLNR